jgi:hypothetical protein
LLLPPSQATSISTHYSSLTKAILLPQHLSYASDLSVFAYYYCFTTYLIWLFLLTFTARLNAGTRSGA